MKIRIIARGILFDNVNSKILLVRNRGASFWYPPGGGWEHETETITEGLTREIREETGIESVVVEKLLFVQEFQESEERKCLELFWLLSASTNDTELDHADLDPNGLVEERMWFTKEDLQELEIFPSELKKEFWTKELYAAGKPDPFLGSF